MRARLFLLILASATTVACNMWSKPASGWTGAAGGEQIEQLFWKDVQAKNWTEVDRHVGGTFAGASAAGTMDRAAFLRQLQGTSFTDFSLSECESRMNGADMMITCTMRATRGRQTATSATLSVWQQLQKGWVMVAHSESTLPAAS
jgi:hypothetical protein